MKNSLFMGAGALAFLLTAPVLAKNNLLDQPGVQEIGTITADFDDESRKWVTIQGNIGGEQGASANWMKADILSSADMSAMADQVRDMMKDQLSPEQLRQLEQLGDSNNPMAQILEQMQSGQQGNTEAIELSITGFDAKAEMDSFMNQAIGINISFDSEEQALDKLGQTIAADISYIVESSGYMPKVLYASDDDNQPSSVVFEQLKFDGANGLAKGTFAGKLCRLDMSNLMAGLNSQDCKQIKGSFDTKLVFEKE